MNYLVHNWFLKVGIFPEVVAQSGLDCFGKSWAKRMWKVAYRDARERAKIFDHSLNELIEFRGFGVMKRIWNKKSGNCIGRARVNNLIEFDNDKIAAKIPFQDYAPNRVLTF